MLVTGVGVAVVGEAVLRAVPSLMPYANTWTYLRSYEEISRVFAGVVPKAGMAASAVVIGDSFTRGAEVAPGRDWVARLVGEYGFDLFNFGIGGSSTVEQWALVSQLEFEAKTTSAVLAVFYNDIGQNPEDLIRYETQGLAPFFRRAERAVTVAPFDHCRDVDHLFSEPCLYFHSYFYATLKDVVRQHVVGEAFQKTVDVTSADLVFDDLYQRYVSKTLDLSELADARGWIESHVEGVAVTLVMIERMQQMFSDRDIRLYVIYLPSFGEVYAEDWARGAGVSIDTSTTIGQVFDGPLAEMGVPFLDLTPHMRKARLKRTPLFLPLDPHPSERGHAEIARAVAPFLKRAGLGSD